jgi:hypothetical protein
MELAQGRVQSRASVLPVLHLRVLLAELVNSKTDLREIGREDGSGWNWLRVVSSGGLCYWQC